MTHAYDWNRENIITIRPPASRSARPRTDGPPAQTIRPPRRKRPRRKKVRAGWGTALLALVMAAISIWAAGRALSAGPAGGQAPSSRAGDGGFALEAADALIPPRRPLPAK